MRDRLTSFLHHYHKVNIEHYWDILDYFSVPVDISNNIQACVDYLLTVNPNYLQHGMQELEKQWQELRKVNLKEFEVVDALPVEGKDGVLNIFEHVLDVKGRDGILFNTYLVCSFDEKAYNTAVEDARSKGISTETVSKTDFRNEKYVAIEKNRDALVSFARSGRPFLFVDEEQIVDYEEFREEMKFCKKYLNFDIAEHIDSNIHELGKQELFNRYREAFKDFSGVDIVQDLHIFDGEEYWQELSEERRDAFYDAWQQSKHLFYDKQDIEQEMER